ncbi:GLIPR1-like protein 1 [Pipistrellus kuhlii]|uniref:GLIPR1-like protein 1 n=1 Tax=Pipistrellus kuhlii TaxID=59472 RepID=UPI00174ED56B|nr:GLIPR1-like protein 1 [Pipistrellus kuhlii]
MVHGNKLNFLWTLGFYLIASRSSPILPSIEDKSFIEDCVEAHNEMRRTVQPPAANMKYMTWDEGLAKTAKSWADQCKFEHNKCPVNHCHPTFPYVGENIWLGRLNKFKPAKAIRFWYNERAFYTYASQLCTKVCGHYTQVVWADSHKVGCAMSICPKLGYSDSLIFVCNYGPAGNYLGKQPYTEGASCSTCGKEDTCENSLCRNEVRERLTKYPNWHPQGQAPQLAACNLLCLLCVLLRMC